MADETPSLRQCIGSARFGIEPHEAPIEDFPRQPSQKDGLGRMCREHWREYTSGLSRDAKARKAAEAGDAPAAAGEEGPSQAKPVPARKPRPEAAPTTESGSQGDAG